MHGGVSKASHRSQRVAREGIAAKRDRAVAIVAALQAAYPHSTCALDYDGPWQLLVATVLSAQTTDRKVNEVTPDLFARWPRPAALGAADLDEVGKVIGSIGLWRQKARSIVGLSRAVGDSYGGEVPRGVAQLLALPGVGRKTATAVLGTAFGLAAGVTVDTHMLRINRLLRLSRQRHADKMAEELERLIAPAAWSSYTHRIIDHGRLVCVARRPRCGVCPLAALCPSAFDAKAGYHPANDSREPASAQRLSWRSRWR